MLPSFPVVALVRRELVAVLRKTRSFVWLAVFVGVAVCTMTISWPGENVAFNQVRYVSGQVLGYLTLILFAACVMFVPALAATSIVGEREQETFDLVHMTLIRPIGILGGKLINAVGLYFLFVVAAMPALSVLMFGVGMDYTTVLYTICLLLATCLTCASAGLLASCAFRRGFLCIAGAYVLSLLILAVPPLMMGFVSALMSILMGYWRYSVRADFAFFTSSPIVLLTLLPTESSYVESAHVFVSIGVQLFVSAALIYLASRMLRRGVHPPKVVEEKPIDDPVLLLARKKQFPFYLIDPLKRKKPIEDGFNPIHARELRWGLYGRSAALVRIFYTLFPIFFFMGMGMIVIGTTAEREWVLAWLMYMTILILLLAPAMLSNTFTKEFEQANIDMLRLTLVSPGQIVRGKAAAGAFSLAPALAAAITAGVPILLIERSFFLEMFTGYTTMAVCCGLSLTLGLLSSIITRQTSASVILSYALSFIVFIGAALAALFVMYFSAGDAPREVLEECEVTAAFFSPIWASIAVHVSRLMGSFEARAGFWLLNQAVFGAFSCAVFLLTVKLFSRHCMRET